MELIKLKEPFPAKDIEWRVQSAGTNNGKIWARVLAYVTNRAIMDRLDDVCGSDKWKNEQFVKGPEGGILCGISIKIGEEWVTKWDGAENTEVESVKGGLSSAMKRAAVQWGIGRYLYNLEAGYAVISNNGGHWQKGKQGKYDSFKWDAPALPPWALPNGTKQSQPADVPDPYMEMDKEFYLTHPLLDEKQKDFIRNNPMTDDLRARVEAKIEGLEQEVTF